MEEILGNTAEENIVKIIDCDKYVVVQIFMTEEQMTDAFLNGGVQLERKILMKLRDSLFPHEKPHLFKFDTEEEAILHHNLFPKINDYKWFNSTFFLINSANNLDNTLIYIRDRYSKFNNQETLKKEENNTMNTREFEDILNYQNYYSPGSIEMDYGSHGPEMKNGKLYISIYHYLEFIGDSPWKYNTFRLGEYLSTCSNDYLKCKYENQSFEISKFNIEVIKKEKLNFKNYLK